MAFVISLILPFLAVALLIGATSATWWSTLTRPWTFVVLGTFIGLGVHRLVQALVEVVKFILQSDAGGYFLEHRDPSTAIELAKESLTKQALVEVALVLFFGYFTLAALRSALIRD